MFLFLCSKSGVDGFVVEAGWGGGVPGGPWGDIYLLGDLHI